MWSNAAKREKGKKQPLGMIAFYTTGDAATSFKKNINKKHGEPRNADIV